VNIRDKAAERVQRVLPSATVSIFDQARALVRQGVDLISLAAGDPDFDTPPHVIEAAEKAIREGETHYVPSIGLQELREAIADKLASDNNLAFDPGNEIIVTPGAKLGLFAAVMSTVDPGDEVLILDPAWGSYASCVQLAGGTPVHVPLSQEDNFMVSRPKLQAQLTSRSKLLMINAPNNPTGRVFRQDELEAMAKFVLENDLVVLSDEIYEKILYEDYQHTSIGSLPDMLERTIIVNGFSKAYAMSGWRLGYVAAKAPLAQHVLKVQQHSVTCAGAFIQQAGVAALRGPQDFIAAMVAEYGRRRDVIVEGLNRLPGVSCAKPEGAFYAFPDISQTGLSGMEFADKMLQEARVALTPGVAFGESGVEHVRLSYTSPVEMLEQAITRMEEVL
jgi:aspartate aminotransferase